ncbi:tripartite tricarboxylate transporter substrate binding protein [Ramlibacter henchirensis]|uniref:Tripartite tricarboxylate transporter substrate binding protein n=1 Tax=Ramlibacter henchirensis TaxID=204072 RepID=A0A4Z0BUZ4_9BURK|nr:tripartite tricarboxylate transporter substrate binding protein [Ramlibacter henchirensis]TFZ03147.1 tripartite tricarboxylate transporter substrate binding protein [Ramlibacter henchirensis]
MNKTSRRGLLATVLCALAVPASVLAQSFPAKPIELIVPYPAGGGTDVLARAFALAAVKHLPQPMVVVNKPGAAGMIGLGDVLNGKEPGYKVGVLATDLMTQPNMGLTKITHEDFTPIARLNYDPAAITVRADAPWKTVEEFIAAAKKGDFRIGNGGNGSTWHLAAAAVEDKTGAKFNHIPFAGANPAALSLLGGHIEAITVSAAEVFPHVAAGKLKLLAVMSDERIKGFENVPTLKEKGLDISIGTWRGLAVPKGTPPDIVAVLRAATAKTVQEQSLRDALEKQNMGYAYAEGEAFAAVMAKDHAFYRALIQKLGLKGQ